jgi:hypothetical protein
MTLCEKLVAHKGRLILLKTELYWYDGRGWDGCPGRICLILDTVAFAPARAATAVVHGDRNDTDALLLIDGRPHWVWVGADDLELL